jgi:hypothetical protein
MEKHKIDFKEVEEDFKKIESKLKTKTNKWLELDKIADAEYWIELIVEPKELIRIVCLRRILAHRQRQNGCLKRIGSAQVPDAPVVCPQSNLLPCSPEHDANAQTWKSINHPDLGA